MPEISAPSYFLLGLLLVAALASLFRGLRAHRDRIAHGKAFSGPRIDRAGVLARINWRAFISRGVFTSRLRQRRWSGIAHGLLFFGALALICGHALFALSLSACRCTPDGSATG
ncbi:MAG: hypothetical protein IPM40_03680 [Gammaproteobacteria bacterium]|nr:hypothetical protein [Gammaproteobacteria bacterium]